MRRELRTDRVIVRYACRGRKYRGPRAGLWSGTEISRRKSKGATEQTCNQSLPVRFRLLLLLVVSFLLLPASPFTFDTINMPTCLRIYRSI